MFHFRQPFTVLLALSPAFIWGACGQSQGNSTYLEGLINFLQANGHSRLANATQKINDTQKGQEILAALPEGNWTLFAPDDQAFSNQTSQGNGSTEDLAAILSYHFLRGNFVNSTATPNPSNGSSAELISGVYPNNTVGRTLLNDTEYVHLAGNASQVLAWSKSGDNDSITILNQPSNNVTVENSTLYSNILISSISAILSPPPVFSTALERANLTILSQVLAALPSPPGFFRNGTNGTLLQALDEVGNSNATDVQGGYTIFAPDDSALERENSTLQGLLQSAQNGSESGREQLRNLIENHIINGTSVYSTELAERNISESSFGGGNSSNSPSSSGENGRRWYISGRPSPRNLFSRFFALLPRQDDTNTPSSGGSNRTELYSAAGEPFAVLTNSSGTFIKPADNSTAPDVKIVRGDVLTQNGVVHIIDGVLFETDSDEQRAEQAYSSATSEAAAEASSTESGPIGVVPGIMTGSETDTSSSTSSASESVTSTESQSQTSVSSSVSSTA